MTVMDKYASFDECLYVGMVRKMLTEELAWFRDQSESGWKLYDNGQPNNFKLHWRHNGGLAVK